MCVRNSSQHVWRNARGRLGRGQPVAQVSINLNNRSYRFDCGDGDAERLAKLAHHVKDILDRLVGEHGNIGDERLVLMAALTIADELFEARADIDDLLDDQTDRLKLVSADLADDVSANTRNDTTRSRVSGTLP